MGTIVERLKEYIDFKGIAVSIAEKEIGVSNSSLSKPFKAKTTIKTDTLEKFLLFYTDISPEWILTGKGEMIKTQSDNNKTHSKELADARLEIIEFQKEKIALLEKQLSESKYYLKEPILYQDVAEPTPELIKKNIK